MRRPFLSLCAALAITSVSASAYTLPPPPTPSNDAASETLKQLSRGVAKVAKDANQAIVFVSVYKNVAASPNGHVDPFEFFFGPRGRGGPGPDDGGGGGRSGPGTGPGGPQRREGGLGSGFFVDLKKGYILTNNHVVQGADEIQIKLANGDTHEAKVVGRDANTDIAVIQVKKDDFRRDGLQQLGLGNSDQVEVGDFVVALGAPFGLEASLSFGVVSALGRGNLDITKLGNFIQTDAAINPGNSGGPLLNLSGQVIGVNTAIYSRSGGYNGIGFAVPANLVRTIAEQLVVSGRIQRGYLGVFLQPIDNDLRGGLNLPGDVKGGALVAKVAGGSPADKAGMEPGDVITEVNGTAMKESSAIVNTIGLMKPGTAVALKTFRDGKGRSVNVTIGQHPDDESEPAPKVSSAKDKDLPYGMLLVNLTKPLKAKHSLESDAGALVTEVESGSIAERSGMKSGDLILKVDGKKVDGVAAFKGLVKGKSRALVWIERAGEFYFVQIKE